MTVTEIQAVILAETGFKTTVKKGSGSMLGYTCFSVNKNLKFDFNWRREFIERFPKCDVNPSFCSEISIQIYHGITA